MREHTLWALLGLLILAGVVSGWVTSQPHTIHPQLAHSLPAPRSQPVPARTLRPSLGEPLRVIPIGPDHGLGAPLRFEVEPDGSIVTVDYHDLRLKRVSPSGEVTDLTDPRARLKSPMDLVRAASGLLWITDPKGGALYVLDSDGHPVGSGPAQAPADPALRLAVSPTGRLFALTPTADGHLFEGYDLPRATPSVRFGALIEPPNQMPYTTDGSIAPTASGGLVYAPRYVGVLARYDDAGSLRYLVQTLEPSAPPTLTRKGGRLRGDPKARVVSQALAVAGNAVLLIHPEERTATGKSTPAFLDLYDLDDGTYRASWALERPWTELRVAGDRLYALTADGIEVYPSPSIR